MDRRFILFIVLSMLLLVANTMWNARNAPKRPPAGAGNVAQQDEPPGAGGNDAADPQADADADPESAGDDAEPENAAVEERAAETDDAVDAEPDVPAEYVSLGSVDPASPYRMLVTVTNVGAAVRRVELSSPRYLDEHDRTGYLGHLELSEGDGSGVRVQAVGPGTPAAVAGLQPADRIVSMQIGEREPVEVATIDAFDDILARTKPGAEITLQVDRAGAQQTLTAKLRRRPLEVIRPEAENVMLRQDALPPGFESYDSFLLTLPQIGADTLKPEARELAGLDLTTAAWRVAERTADSVTMERSLPQRGITVTKRYALAKIDQAAQEASDPAAYHLTLSITIARDAAEADAPADADANAALPISYRLSGANGLPIEGWWYATKIGRTWGAVGLRDVIGRYLGADPVQLGAPVIAKGEAPAFESGSLAYMGVDAQYFAVALVPAKDDPAEEWISTARASLVGPPPDPRTTDSKFSNVTTLMTSNPVPLEPGQSVTHNYTVFAGPKRPAMLAQYHPEGEPGLSLDDFVYYGWFGGIARAMVGLLHVFYGFVGNYGIAIIMLTVLVRGVMFPVSRGQAKSMAKMQELRPEMERIKERMKGDQQKQAKAMQDLYRKHNVNPLAGCLPVLMQLPVFVGLYRGLAVDIELRQAPLFSESIHWCSNLAAPDMFYDWSWFMPNFITSGQGFFGLGPYLNLLPLVTIALYLWQQHLFMPEPTNEQAALQQKMMKYMMLLMGLLFYKVPSGLCLYFIASSLWGIAERKLVPPPTTSTGGAAVEPVGGSGRAAGSAKHGRASGARGPGAKKQK